MFVLENVVNGLTISLAREDDIFEIRAEKISLDSCDATSAGTTGVILAAARSSTFLATAKVSTLLREKKICFRKTKYQNWAISVTW